MYDFFMTFINNATSLIDLGHRSEKDSENNSCPAIEPVVNKRKSIANEKLVPELEVLANEFGELTEGKQIEVELSRLLELLPRQRKKSDAYKGIRSELKKMGVELIITKTKTNKKMDEKFNEFRDVPNYPGLQVRGDGKAVRAVKSLSGSAQKVQYYNYTIKQTSFGRAYIIRRPKGEEEILYVDRLVASCFFPLKSECPYVAHKDFDITNNHYDNLEWVNKDDYVSKYHLNRIKDVNGERFAWWKNNWYISEKGHVLIDGTLYANAKVYTSLYDSDLDLWRVISPYISCNGNRIFIEEGVKAVWNKDILHIDGDFNNWQETNLKIVDTDSPEAKNNDMAWENWRKQENMRLFKERRPNDPYPSFLD